MSIMSNCKAAGWLLLFSLLCLRCWGGDTGAGHLHPLGWAGWCVIAAGKGREESPGHLRSGGGKCAWVAINWRGFWPE